MGRIFLLLVFILASCGVATNDSLKKPKWIYTPPHKEGKICGVGYSAMHVRGFSYQRALAISRGIDEIARQMGVKVNSSLEYYMGKTGSSTSSELNVYTIQTTEGKVIKAKIEDSYYDEKTDELFILVCTY